MNNILSGGSSNISIQMGGSRSSTGVNNNVYRDLFADTGLPGWRWALFFFSLFIWAWLVHAMARRALQFDEWVPEAHRPGGLTDDDRVRLRELFRVPATWVPRSTSSARRA